MNLPPFSSDNSTANPLMVWEVSDRVIVLGGEDTVVDGVRHSEQHLASIALADGIWKGWNLTAEAAIP